MIVADVSEKDVKVMAQLANMLNVGEWSVSGKDVCAAADSIRWFHQLAVQVSQVYSTKKSETSAPPPEAKPPEPTAPTSGFGEGVKIKSYNPGKIGKK